MMAHDKYEQAGASSHSRGKKRKLLWGAPRLAREER